MVPQTGIEPVRPFGRGILSPVRLPISPPRHAGVGLIGHFIKLRLFVNSKIHRGCDSNRCGHLKAG